MTEYQTRFTFTRYSPSDGFGFRGQFDDCWLHVARPVLSEADDFPRIMGLPGGGEAPVGEPRASRVAAVQ